MSRRTEKNVKHPCRLSTSSKRLPSTRHNTAQ